MYGGLGRRGIDPVIPAKKEPIRSKIPLRRFRYDAKHECARCDLASICLSPGRNTELVVILGAPLRAALAAITPIPPRDVAVPG